ncbi:polysaccharide deacetylase family protein [Aquimarina muelleri]|uniref:Polysaccharide deacetylase n=1 Tax=Aquimarina muelleri TaxID=279356 RepID=A0A918JVY4_9FLAO|nr:polysaccharide deacetylase family protein [Aquimarina muelleri]MCX2762158.1 polysaccharide deacetylase family protein [Aquimarina muelleri]GGX16916.1 polysaccharide deacetylase [Aquimarina muelleri]
MLLIYVQKVTPRVSYIFRQVCKRILGLDIDFTSKIESFIAHDGPKFSYGKHPLGKELYFQSVELLFDHGLNDVDIQVSNWEDTKCFFEVKHSHSALPFDIFAASFYLLTRYEEYLPHVKDGLGRFPATKSIAFINDFLKDPVVDIWAYKFKKNLLIKYPDLEFQKKSFTIIPVVSVGQTFAYKNKGILRSIGGGLIDIWKLQLDILIDRIKVIVGVKKDPYDIFDFIIELQKKKKRKSRILFGLGDYSTYEKNIGYNHPGHHIVIKHIADYIEVGLKVSYDAISDISILKKEKLRAENIINRRLKYVMCTFFKIKLPEAYRNFIELEIKEDYSMGYSGYSGFRAGTCSPFMFYDLDYEVQTPLVINSFCICSQGYNQDANEPLTREEIVSYINKVKEVNGVFIPVFSNVVFSNLQNQHFWKSILEFIWTIENE